MTYPIDTERYTAAICTGLTTLIYLHRRELG